MNTHRQGILYAVLAYGIWGLFPVYWKLLGSIPALEILTKWGLGRNSPSSVSGR